MWFNEKLGLRVTGRAYNLTWLLLQRILSLKVFWLQPQHQHFQIKRPPTPTSKLHDTARQAASASCHQLTSTAMADKVESPHTHANKHNQTGHHDAERKRPTLLFIAAETFWVQFNKSLIATEAVKSLYSVVTAWKKVLDKVMQHMKGALERRGRGDKMLIIPLLLGYGVLDLDTFPMKFHFTWEKKQHKT